MDVTKTTKFGANYFKELALKQNKKLASIPLKDNCAAKILTNDKSMDCYIVKNGELKEASGFITYDEGEYFNKVGARLEALQRRALDGVNVAFAWGESLMKNVKDL